MATANANRSLSAFDRRLVRVPFSCRAVGRDLGSCGDKPVQADYDGDNKDDLAIFRPSEGNWYVFRSSDNGVTIVNWGSSTDVPVPAIMTVMAATIRPFTETDNGLRSLYIRAACRYLGRCRRRARSIEIYSVISVEYKGKSLALLAGLFFELMEDISLQAHGPVPAEARSYIRRRYSDRQDAIPTLRGEGHLSRAEQMLWGREKADADHGRLY